ncbi:MAG: SHOCT domain-containing protein [Gammaproteobacteria bacterium]|jgi:hypothetical protein|nr:SHOCT domain-containing protein [Gammaproteobacteria bacterium]MBT3723380.1 SHOCT domain-containing protein [Gammaproteobacteria bacterium]MBT4078017.1 SHOCT domain-containing protein [Gammaproteobacteria bacterium]MBT4449353.1 SHOCT domain-containing protein [Gammaproteobacteria bacterium]MBT4859179.1 SHOCT domain-containing protein [Gammaproteobacteria bacterium]
MNKRNMQKKLITYLLWIPLISSCSGIPLLSEHKNNIPVDSIPTGASIYVMGKFHSTTPSVVNQYSIHPITYNKEDESLYGRITIKHEGCQEKSVIVNSQIISSGLKTTLDCTEKTQTVTKQQDNTDKSVVQRLQQLQTLKDEKLISDEEFREIRIRILDSI